MTIRSKSLETIGDLTISLWYYNYGPLMKAALTKRSCKKAEDTHPYSLHISHITGNSCENTCLTTRKSQFRFSQETYEFETWTHLILIVENDTVTWVENGVALSAGCFGSVFTNQLEDNNEELWFGANPPGVANQAFNGSLDDIGIWNRALNDAELLALFNNEQPILGCTNSEACNFNVDAVVDDGSCIPSGCTDSYACNFAIDAACDDGSCDYTCCPGPGCCDLGLTWNWELGLCQDLNPADINLDGCVQLNDLLDLLTAYGDCGSEESAWQCGDPLEYQGYDYETVQIGEQCWFAENLRSENYDNGDEILTDLSPVEWATTVEGAVAIYGESANCENYAPDIDACDTAQSLNMYGRLYNWYAVQDDRSLCPSDWHVPSDEEWITMEISLGMTEEDANATGVRGTNEGAKMKDTFGWSSSGNGVNTSSFSGLPGGARNVGGNSTQAGNGGFWWSSSPQVGGSAWFRALSSAHDRVLRSHILLTGGYSIRCIKDTE